MRRAAHIVWLLLAVLVRQSGLCALLPGTVLPQAALAAPPAPLSGNRSDTVQHVELSFRFDRSLLDSAYRDNSSALHTLRNWLGPSCCASRIDSIGIFSYSSMEGYGWHNGQLARDRGRAVKGYLVWKYPHLNQYRIYIHPQGEDWAGLLRRLSDMPDLPSRDQIANLFDTGLSEEELKNRFRILIDSQSYRYLQSTLFPSLRRAIVRIYWKDSVPDVLTAGIRSDAFSAAIADAPEKEVIYTAEEKPPLHGSATPQTTPPQPALPPVPASLPETAPPRPLRPEPPAPPSTASASSPSTPTHFASLSPVGQNDPRQRQDSPPARWAIKTNLLYWAALAPNLEAELGLGHRWSVGLEALCAWWSNERAHRYYQLFAAGPEVRFRFAGPGRFHGHYVGLYGSAGFYDLENRKTGYQGDFWSAGITYGYQLPVGRSFGVEFAVGAGMIGSSYKTYEPRDGLYVYQQTKRIRYTGLTKARISLLWRFGGKGGRL